MNRVRCATGDTVGAGGRTSTITTRRLFHPCLDTFLRALLFTYRHVRVDSGTVVAVAIRGEASGGWYIVQEANAWRPVAQPKGNPKATVSLG